MAHARLSRQVDVVRILKVRRGGRQTARCRAAYRCARRTGRRWCIVRYVAGSYRDWHGHVIVCGLRRVGLRIIEQLTLSGVLAVVIDESPDPVSARIVEGWGVPLVAGSSRAAETLTESGLAGAMAVICVQDDDLHALEAALLTRRLRDDVRVVAQLANPAVGRALSQVGVSVLDVAGLSAPSIVEACLRVGVQEMTLSGERFLAVRVTAAKPTSLRGLYGPLAPIAVVPAADGEVAICPGRDELVDTGDQVTLVGTPAELRDAGVFDHAERMVLTARGNRSGRPGHPLRAYRLVLSLLHAADRKLVIALGALLTVLTGATAVLWLTYVEAGARHISLLDAAYFAVETVTTVGYGDYSFRGQAPWLIAFAIILMLAGALFVAVFFALVTNVLVSRRIEEALGRQRITGLDRHVLVVGLGTIGLRVVQQLAAAGTDVVVVEKNEHNRHLGQVHALGVPVVIADATLPEVLRSVQLATAAAVAVLTSDDLANLETGLAVRDQLGARRETTPIVLRIFDPQLARSVQETFGFTDVRSTAALAAPWFVGAALGLDVLSTFYAAGVPLLVARLTVSPGGGLHGLTMLDLTARSRVLAIRRVADPAVLEHPLRRDTRFGAADEAYLIGPYEELLSVLRRDRLSPQSPSLPRTARLHAEPSLPFGPRN
jgi:Trk K+ transport system NAD-binding subunit